MRCRFDFYPHYLLLSTTVLGLSLFAYSLSLQPAYAQDSQTINLAPLAPVLENQLQSKPTLENTQALKALKKEAKHLQNVDVVVKTPSDKAPGKLQNKLQETMHGLQSKLLPPSANIPDDPQSAADLPEPQFAPDVLQNTGASIAQKQPVKARAVVVDIDSNTLNYDSEQDVYVATGQVHILISEQNSDLTADKVTYDQNKNLLVAEGHVVIHKNGQTTQGVYAKIDLTRQSALINDAATVVNAVRVKAKTALVNQDLVQMENGRLILDRRQLGSVVHSRGSRNRERAREQRDALHTAQRQAQGIYGQTASNKAVDNDDLSSLANNAGGPLETQTLDLNNNNGNEQAKPQHNKGETGLFDNLHWKVKQADVIRGEDGYDEINLNDPTLYFGKHKVAKLLDADLSFDEETQELEYLGPDIGYDPDLGGLYYGPGWDFRLGKGSVRFSPLLGYGGGTRRTRGGRQLENDNGLSVGGILRYRSHDTILNAAFNSTSKQPLVFGEHKFFGGKTKLQVAANEDYNQGFLGYERPGAILQLTDQRKIAQFGNFRVDTFGSIGVAKDDFFPTNQSTFFVDPKGDDPATAGRLQLQAQIRNIAPIVRVGKFLDFGAMAQLAGAAYTTGDFVGLLRVGPTANLQLGDRFRSSLRYFASASTGESPFVFDSYYQGRQNLRMYNAFRVNNFLTVGTRSDFNLLRDNDKGSLVVGNAFYALVGPRDIKLNLAYDFIRKRTYFGINFYPGSGTTNVDFDQLRIFSPQNYGNLGGGPPL